MSLLTSLTAYYSLEEAANANAIDATGRGNTLTRASDPPSSSNPAVVGNCREFISTSNQGLERASSADHQMGDFDFNFAGWFRLKNKTLSQSLLVKSLITGDNRSYEMQYLQTTDRLRFLLYSLGTAASQIICVAATLGAPAINTWYFVEVGYDAAANLMHISVNNGTVDTAAQTGGAFAGTAAFSLGRRGTLDALSDSYIDEVGVWKRLLTAAEITRLYNGGAGRSYAYISDVTAPTVPANLATTPISETQIDLNWDDSTDANGVDHYRIFKDTVFLATSATSSYSATGLTVNTTYGFTVSAVDANGNESARCSNVNGTTIDITAPSVPANLAAVAVSGSQIDLTWDASTDNVGVDHYRVFKDGVFLATNADLSYSAVGLDDATEYEFTVSAVDAADNESAESAPDSATTPDVTAPSVPTGLTAIPFSDTQIDLTWNASTDNVAVDHYKVYKDGVFLANNSDTSYSATGLTSGVTYIFTVSAVDAASNESSQSAGVGGTIPNDIEEGTYMFLRSRR